MGNFGIKIVFISLTCFFSCKSSSEDVIDKKTMAIVFAELKTAEAKVSRLNLTGVDSSRVAFKYLEKQIYKKYKVDSAQYLKSFDFYAKDKKQLLSIYIEAEKIIEKNKNKNTAY
ncbi:DUF4296 domain-containing protein [Lacihabitans soyangensis]|uniref:DUF4296 domain-containing protein n=1 Tax=Lacihabitans soyangensis TaxID=869394 RepID=A0AAE3H6R0_9BACT|nr:DUF4296 domain-containing protein [Lacihabitans soyangensis]